MRRNGHRKPWEPFCGLRGTSGQGWGEKTRELDDQKTGKVLVTEWRERFATLQNLSLIHISEPTRPY